MFYSPWVSIVSGLLVIIFCLTGALVFGFTNVGAEWMKEEKRPWMALIFGVYAVFRAFRIWLSIKKLKKNHGQMD